VSELAFRERDGKSALPHCKDYVDYTAAGLQDIMYIFVGWRRWPPLLLVYMRSGRVHEITNGINRETVRASEPRRGWQSEGNATKK